MQAPTSARQLQMPRLLSARLDHFSLYTAKQTIEVSFTKGAFCLAGANGLGKSTFLAALNFGLTGIVADPSRKFESVDEYYDYSLGFADDFFDGRVDERDRERAQVAVDFKVGNSIYHITRGVFDRESLRALTVEAKDGQGLDLDATVKPSVPKPTCRAKDRGATVKPADPKPTCRAEDRGSTVKPSDPKPTCRAKDRGATVKPSVPKPKCRAKDHGATVKP